MKTKLSQLDVDSIPLQKPGTRKICWDSKLSCFGLKVTSENKSFIVFARAGHGREAKKISVKVGNANELSLAEARLKAAKILVTLRDGTDVNAEKTTKTQRDKVESITLKELYKEYVSKRDLRPRTLSTYETVMKLYLNDWQDKPIISITRDMIEKKLQIIASEPGKRGNRKSQAMQAFTLLRALFRFALERYEIDGKPLLENNPTRKLTQGKSWSKPQVRDSIIHESDLKTWYRAVNKLSNHKKPTVKVLIDYILWLCFSGMRRTEAMSLCWADIDVKRKIVTVKPEASKTGKKRVLPLTSMLLEIIASRHQARTDSLKLNKYLFPGQIPGQHIKEPRRVINLIRQDVDIDWCLHDLRRSYITHASRLVPYPSLKTLVGHSTGGDVTQQHYLKLDVESLRPEAQKITNWLKQKMGLELTPDELKDAVAA